VHQHAERKRATGAALALEEGQKGAEVGLHATVIMPVQPALVPPVRSIKGGSRQRIPTGQAWAV
jgi:hypothetical protein